jgi:hypothetical protein
MEALLDGEADAITRKAVEMALSGDSVALRMCLERIIPPRKDRPINFALPKLATPADAVAANAALVEAVSAGEITPSEAMDLSKLVENFVSAFKAHDLEERLARLEEGQPGGGFSSQSHSRANH